MPQQGPAAVCGALACQRTLQYSCKHHKPSIWLQPSHLWSQAGRTWVQLNHVQHHLLQVRLQQRQRPLQPPAQPQASSDAAAAVMATRSCVHMCELCISAPCVHAAWECERAVPLHACACKMACLAACLPISWRGHSFTCVTGSHSPRL